MSEYYSKEKVMEKINSMIHLAEEWPDELPSKQIVVNERWAMKHVIEGISAEEITPVIHAKWVPNNTLIRSPFAMNYKCSACKSNGFHSKYCPNCGAKMDG